MLQSIRCVVLNWHATIFPIVSFNIIVSVSVCGVVVKLANVVHVHVPVLLVPNWYLPFGCRAIPSLTVTVMVLDWLAIVEDAVTGE